MKLMFALAALLVAVALIVLASAHELQATAAERMPDVGVPTEAASYWYGRPR